MIRIAAFFLLIALLSSAALLPGSPAFADQPSRKATADKPTPATTLARAPVDQLIPWLLDEDRQLRGIAFGEVIFDTTGKKVLTFDPRNETDQRVVKQISAACDQTIKRLNAPDSVIQNVGRINEVSSYFEDTLRELLSSTPGLSCDFPRTIDGKVQRSGYPDLRIVDLASRRVFYFDPKKATNKVREDAVHFIVGFEHERREKNGAWKFTRWDLVDLAQFKVKLKAEFQGTNRDMYRAEAIVATSAK